MSQTGDKIREKLPQDGPMSLQHSFLYHLHYTLAKDRHTATSRDFLHALIFTVRDRLVNGWTQTQQGYYDGDVKRVYYLSFEFLIGRLLASNLLNLDLFEPCRLALEELDIELAELLELEWDAGLGTGGLGRLAACFLDSMATLSLPAYGYGIRYEYGIFFQRINDGYQLETPDNWLRYGNPWEFARPETLFPVRFGGRVAQTRDATGRLQHEWLDTELVMAMAHDIPVPGFRNGIVNTLRLWGAKSSREFDLDYFNHGDYIQAVEDKNRSENLSRVLYPRDDNCQGRELRLKQEYFLVTATLQDILRRYRKSHTGWRQFADKICIQLNDTHPALAIPELMRLLVDLEGLDWDQAWNITVRSTAYTNHTLLPEALERWPVALFERLLPRHLEIMYEINHRFLRTVSQIYPDAPECLSRVSLIEEYPVKQVRMAQLAIVGSHAVNGVSALHSQLLKDEMFHDFNALFPVRFSNKTNGITPRRWLRLANPDLAALISRRLGEGWLTDLDELERLAPLADDAEFRREWQSCKRAAKKRLARTVFQELGFVLNPDSLFDCHVKRIHEYKRQLLCLLHTVVLYQRLRRIPSSDMTPRSVIFSGKAAPAYQQAKLIIKLVHAVADVINHEVGDRLQVLFLPNYSVSLAERIIPGADLSEQISTAGMEASGTGNMKFALNGALTIGTLDGANIEIMDAVGPENIFIFGLTAADLENLRGTGYRPREICDTVPELKEALELILAGHFSPESPRLFEPIVNDLLERDRFFVVADFASYIACQDRVSEMFRHPDVWLTKSILNTAHMGRFSSDRTIAEYARCIWQMDEHQNATPVAHQK